MTGSKRDSPAPWGGGLDEVGSVFGFAASIMGHSANAEQTALLLKRKALESESNRTAFGQIIAA